METIGAAIVAFVTGVAVLAFHYPKAHRRLIGATEKLALFAGLCLSLFALGAIAGELSGEGRTIGIVCAYAGAAAAAYLVGNFFLRWLREAEDE